MGLLSDIANGLADIVVYAPLIAAGVSVIGRKGPAGRTMVEAALTGDVNTFIYDAREILTGVDANGNFQGNWFTATWFPPTLLIGMHKLLKGLVKA